MGICYSEPCTVVLTATEPEPLNLRHTVASVSEAKVFLEKFLKSFSEVAQSKPPIIPKSPFTFTVEMHSGGRTMKPAIYVVHMFGGYFSYSLYPSKMKQWADKEIVIQQRVDWMP